MGIMYRKMRLKTMYNVQCVCKQCGLSDRTGGLITSADCDGILVGSDAEASQIPNHPLWNYLEAIEIR